MPVERKYPTKEGGELVKYLVYYTNADGKRTSKTFDKKAQAAAFEKKAGIEKQFRAPKLTRSDVTFGDAISRFIADSTAGRDGSDPWRYQTIQNHKAMGKRLCGFLPAGTLLKTITISKLKTVRCDIQAADIAASSKRSLWVMIKSVFAYMVSEEILTSDPTATLTLRVGSNIRLEGDKLELFTKEEVKTIVAKAKDLRNHSRSSIKESYDRLWILPILLFETGMRISELLALEWRAVDLSERTLLVCQTFNRKNELDTVKATASRRRLTISKALGEVLFEMQWQAKGQFVISGKGGQSLLYRNALRWWDNLLHEAGVRKGGFHKARHYYASCMIEKGVNPKVLTTNMGHADVRFTMNVYGHLFDDRDTRDKKRELAEALSVLSEAA